MYFYHGLQQELDNFRMKIAAYQYLRGRSEELHVIGWDVSVNINHTLWQYSRVRSGKIRVKASAIGKLIMRTLGFWRNDLTAVASGAPRIHTASTLPSFIASTAAVPAKGKNVAVSEFTPPLPRICSADVRVALPSGPTAMRFPMSRDS